MKKKILVSAVLALVLMMAFSVTAFAEESYNMATYSSYWTNYNSTVYPASTDRFYYDKCYSWNNYSGSRGYCITDNSLTSLVPPEPYAGKVSLNGRYGSSYAFRYRGYNSGSLLCQANGRYGTN